MYGLRFNQNYNKKGNFDLKSYSFFMKPLKIPKAIYFNANKTVQNDRAKLF